MRFALCAFAAFCLFLSADSADALELVTDGRAAATILLPGQPHPSEQKAAEALVKYLKAATGARLEIVREPRKPAGTLVSVGRTQLAAATAVTAGGLEADGYRIVARGGNLFLLGRDLPRTTKMPQVMGAQGTWRAALNLLERLGFRWIQPGEKGWYAPAAKSLAVADDLNVCYRPPFLYGIGRMINQGDWSMANGFRSAVNLYTEGGHTWCTFVPASLWETHPEYFQMRGGKRVKPEGDGYFLCPSNPDVQKLLADGLRRKFDEGYEWAQLGQSDGYRPCECDACKNLDKPGECHEQVQIPHDNVIKMVGATHPDRKVHFMVYGPTVKPSSRIDRYPENAVGELGITWTLAQAFVGKENFDREKLVAGHEAALKAWSRLIPSGLTAYVYFFGTYHQVGLTPKMSPRMVAEAIRRLHRFNVKGIYFCGGGENWGLEGPSYYVAGRLLVGPSQDWEPLVEEYCRLTFGPAAATMRSYYDVLFRRLENAPFTSPNAMVRLMTIYPAGALDELEALLARARSQAGGDETVQGWLRLVEISQRQLALILRAYLAYDRYQGDPSKQGFEQIRSLVCEYRELAGTIRGMNRAEPAFVRDFFPYWGAWHQNVETNGGMGGSNLSAPFTWDFAALGKGGSLPGGVCNPGFESTDIERTRPADWHVHPPETKLNVMDAQVFHGGRQSLHFALAPVGGNGASYVVYQQITRRYEPGRQFRFSCWVKTRDLKGSASIGIARYPLIPEDRQIRMCPRRLSGTNDWTRLEITFPVREGMGQTQVRCVAGGASGEVWFDDAVFEEVRVRDPSERATTRR